MKTYMSARQGPSNIPARLNLNWKVLWNSSVFFVFLSTYLFIGSSSRKAQKQQQRTALGTGTTSASGCGLGLRGASLGPVVCWLRKQRSPPQVGWSPQLTKAEAKGRASSHWWNGGRFEHLKYGYRWLTYSEYIQTLVGFEWPPPKISTS